MKKLLPILIIIASIVVAILFQYELIEFYNKEYKQLTTLEQLSNASDDTIVELEVTPNLFFYAEDSKSSRNSYFLTYEFGNELVVNATDEVSDSTDTSITFKGTIRRISLEDQIYKSLIAVSDDIPLIELEEGIDEGLLDDIVIDWNAELPESILLFEQVTPPVYPNTRFLLGILLVSSACIVAIFVAQHNREE